VDRCNVVNWIQSNVLRCAMLLILIEEQHSGYLKCCELDTGKCIELCCDINNDIGKAVWMDAMSRT